MGASRDREARRRTRRRRTRGTGAAGLPLAPPGPHLVAERGGRIEAAISLATGVLVADPFLRTAELCELLRCHAGQVRVRPEPAPAAPRAPSPRLVTA